MKYYDSLNNTDKVDEPFIKGEEDRGNTFKEGEKKNSNH